VSIAEKKKQLVAELILFFVTFLWGTTFVGVKLALQQLPPNLLIAYRFTISLFLILLWQYKLLKKIRWNELKWGLLLGLFLFIAYVSQTIGLKYTQANKSAFITALSVVLVPVISLVVEKKIPKKASLIGIVLAVIGLYLLLVPQSGEVNKGDLYTLICAFFWGLYIVVLSYSSVRVNANGLLLGQFLIMTLCCWITVFVMRERLTFPSQRFLFLILYLGVFCSFLTTFLQTGFQRYTSSTRTALIFTLEPIIATALSFILLYEVLSAIQIIGAVIIITGVLVSELS